MKYDKFFYLYIRVLCLHMPNIVKIRISENNDLKTSKKTCSPYKGTRLRGLRYLGSMIFSVVTQIEDNTKYLFL